MLFVWVTQNWFWNGVPIYYNLALKVYTLYITFSNMNVFGCLRIPVIVMGIISFSLLLWLFYYSLSFKRGQNVLLFFFCALFVVLFNEGFASRAALYKYCRFTEHASSLDMKQGAVVWVKGFKCCLALAVPWDMTPTTSPMMTMTTVEASKVFRSWNTSRLWAIMLLMLTVNPVFSGE